MNERAVAVEEYRPLRVGERTALDNSCRVFGANSIVARRCPDVFDVLRTVIAQQGGAAPKQRRKEILAEVHGRAGALRSPGMAKHFQQPFFKDVKPGVDQVLKIAA